MACLAVLSSIIILTFFYSFQDENENEEGDEEMVVGGGAAAESDSEGESARGRTHAFFQRSDSTLCLGCPPPDPFNSQYSLHLLQYAAILKNSLLLITVSI